jgi:hypothetical protein
MNALKRAIEEYISAKDGNHPHLIEDAFTRDAKLSIRVNSSNISFPSETKGSDEISNVLVTQFSQRFENVYTLCICNPPEDTSETFVCTWLVCMTEKDSGAVRVGLGIYEWQLDASDQKIQNLAITIDQMHVLEKRHRSSVLNWIRRLPYPWCSNELIAPTIPDIPVRQEIFRGLSGFLSQGMASS